MAILYFQLLIIVTLYLASLVGKKSLVIACAAWSLFTLAKVFLPGLLLLQLLTIWACYWFFKRKKTTPCRRLPQRLPTSSRQPQRPLKVRLRGALFFVHSIR